MSALDHAQMLSSATEHLLNSLYTSHLQHHLHDSKLRQRVEQKVQEWAYEAQSNLDQQHPFLQAQQQLEHWLSQSHVDEDAFLTLSEQYQQFMQQLGWPDTHANWQSLTTTASQRNVQFQLLREKWQRKLTEAVADWEFQQLAQQRDEFLAEIKEFLTHLQRMAKHQAHFGVDTGILIDYSSGQLTEHDVEKFQHWCGYLEQDSALLALAKRLGAAKPTRHPRQAASLHAPPDPTVELQLPLYEEIVGIQLARDLALSLPNELALLADPDLEVLFDLKYLEANLMSFSMQAQSHAKALDQPQLHKQLGQKGPMIICLDTSGSMHGQPELIAKAVTLFLAMQAMQQHRAIYMINFSTGLSVMQLKKGQALDDILHFLSQSFHGGTDLMPALNHAMALLAQPHFHHADVLVISDFVMGNLDEEVMQQLEQHQQQGHGFYALAIGNFRFEHLNAGLFDQQWVYQPKTGQVIALDSA